MKIVDVEVIPLGYATDDDPPTRRSFAVLKVLTDEGLVGWGEASDCYGHRHPQTLAALVAEDLRWALIDQDPLRPDDLMHRLRQRMFPSLGARELVIQVLSAIEIALHDLRGQVLDVSISDLLGRCHDTVAIYAAGKPAHLVDPSWHVDFFTPLLERGVTAVKVRTGRDLEWDERLVREVRASLPLGTTVLVDGKYNYRVESAIAFSRTLAEIGAHCFEEPIVDVNIEAIRRVADASPVPLAYGEHSFTLQGFRELINWGGVRIVEPDVTICGGISEGRKIAALAEAHDVELLPHCGGLTAIGMAANLHLAASLPNVGLFEYDARSYQPLRDELAAGAPFAPDGLVDGRICVPSGPGLGIDIDAEVLSRYPYHVDEEIARSFPVYATPHI